MRQADNALTTITKAAHSVTIMYQIMPFATVFKITQQIVSAAMGPLSLFFIQRLIDAITVYIAAPIDIMPIVMWIALLVGAALLSDNINYIGAIQVVSIQHYIDKKMTDVFMERLCNLDYTYFEDPSIHDTLEKMGREPQRRVFNVFQGITDIIASTIAAIGLCLVVAQVFVWFSILLFFVLVFIMWFQFKGISMQVALWGQQAVDDREMSYLIELLSEKHSLYELKVFGSIDYIKNKWKKTADRVLSDRITTAIRALRFHIAGDALIVAWQAIMTIISVVSLLNGAITLGLFVSLVTSAKAISAIKSNLEMAFTKITRFQLEMQHVEKFMALPEEVDPLSQSAQGKVCSADDKLPVCSAARAACTSENTGLIRFEQVDFTYPGTNRQILHNVSFSLEPERHIALVGRNGAGKSTIVKLLCGLYTPQSGLISIDGQPLQEIPSEQLSRKIAFIFQDFVRYELTLRENIALGALEKMNDDEALRRALRMSCFDAENTSLDTELGKIADSGIDLSGGQWQRLALARALVSDSPFIVLDEPTASLDPVAESDMYRSFAEVMSRRACLMISHRLASAKMCDEILVLDKGQIVEQGSHAGLMSKNGLYHHMFALQSSWYLKDEPTEGNGECAYE